MSTGKAIETYTKPKSLPSIWEWIMKDFLPIYLGLLQQVFLILKCSKN